MSSITRRAQRIQGHGLRILEGCEEETFVEIERQENVMVERSAFHFRVRCHFDQEVHCDTCDVNCGGLKIGAQLHYRVAVEI